MSKVGWKAQTAQIATGTAKKTLLQVVAAANHGLGVKKAAVSFKGVSNTDAPVLVEIVRQSTAGTMTSLTPVKSPDDTDETLQVTAQHTATAEPTEGDVLFRELIHPQTGLILPLDEKVGGGDRIAIVVTATVDVNAVARLEGDE